MTGYLGQFMIKRVIYTHFNSYLNFRRRYPMFVKKMIKTLMASIFCLTAVSAAGIRKQAKTSKKLFASLMMGLVLLLPIKAIAYTSSPYLDVQTLISDLRVELSETSLTINANALALGSPYGAIYPVDFLLTAQREPDNEYYSGTLSVGTLLSASFTDLSITAYNFGYLTSYDISADLSYTDGLLAQDFSSGLFFGLGLTNSRNRGFLISRIYSETPVPETPVPLPSAMIFLFSGVAGLAVLKKKARPNLILISG